MRLERISYRTGTIYKRVLDFNLASVNGSALSLLKSLHSIVVYIHVYFYLKDNKNYKDDQMLWSLTLASI
jgi:hypothetical protein